MSETGRLPASAGARMSRTILVGFLGSVVRTMGNWMPIAGAVDLMGRCGLDESSVRTAIFRLKQRGWLVPETRARAKGYLLTDLALESLAAGDEIVWHARQAADLDEGWCIVNFSVPESARAKRHKLRAHLASLGFGNIGSGVWIAPARMLDAAKRAIDELELTAQSAVFVGDYVAGQDLDALLSSGWDLAEIDRRYREFIEAHAGEADRIEAAVGADGSGGASGSAGADGSGDIDGEQAFVAYITVINEWRKLPFRDPGLPREVLAADWPAPAAGLLFERLVTLLEGRALAYAAAQWPAATTTAATD
ncbi:PaaX family transcriptional regulator [Herbiconiux daphne]|uniref:PaaX family transcriptional regulator n=1 Tax=Herbiconiux daphne TaxID=2970914 RepID=A0ABT2H7Z8_9MICO|nr:PaaX family transcriptional regulator C-terminal domain-containing protein [Herbiconiux daphne]MCS5736090.1 PaaX family transcriptional regulator [Herbiconiux daphne]